MSPRGGTAGAPRNHTMPPAERFPPTRGPSLVGLRALPRTPRRALPAVLAVRRAARLAGSARPGRLLWRAVAVPAGGGRGRRPGGRREESLAPARGAPLADDGAGPPPGPLRPGRRGRDRS